MSSLQAVTSMRVAEYDVDIKEPDPELQLLLDVEVLIFEGAGEASLGLSRAGVVSAREEELVEPHLTKLRPAVADEARALWGAGRLRPTESGVALTVVQPDPHLTPPPPPARPGVELQPVQQSCIGALVLQHQAHLLPLVQLQTVTVSNLAANKPVDLAQLPVVVLCVELAGGAARLSLTDMDRKPPAAVITKDCYSLVHSRARNPGGLG